MIDNYSEKKFIVYQPVDRDSHYWSIETVDKNGLSYPWDELVEFGSIYAYILNYISHNLLQKDCGVKYIIRDANIATVTLNGLSVENFFNLLDVFNGVFSMCEEARKKHKDREMSYIDRDEIFFRYEKIKDIAYILLNPQLFHANYAYDYLNKDYLFSDRSFNEIIQKDQICKLADGKEYIKYYVKDTPALFALDLHEILFGTAVLPSFVLCNECGNLFPAAHRSERYCPSCNTPERTKKRKQESRSNKLVKLNEEIENRFRYRWEKMREKNRNGENTSNIQKVHKAWMDYRNDYSYYKDIIEQNGIPDSNHNTSITSEEKLVEWLEKKLEEVKAFLAKYKE